MSDRDALFQAILDSPDDDLPRQVYADWLEDQGDPQAQFIRIQCELAAMEADSWRRRELLAAERRLLQDNARQWAGPIAEVALDYHFRRGFVEEVTVSAHALREHAPELLRAAPVRRIVVDSTGVYFTREFAEFLIRETLNPSESHPEVVMCPSPPELLAEVTAREHVMFPLGHYSDILQVAVGEGAPIAPLWELETRSRRQIGFVEIHRGLVVEAINAHYQLLETPEVIEIWHEPRATEQGAEDLLQHLLSEAIRARASAVKVEAVGDRGRVRYLVNSAWVDSESVTFPRLWALARFVNTRTYLTPWRKRFRKVGVMDVTVSGIPHRLLVERLHNWRCDGVRCEFLPPRDVER
jgi:uncharacterized protein (TIGR02996 family)